VVAASPAAVGLLLVTIVANLLLWPVYQSFMPLFAGQQLGLGPTGLALLLASAGTGGLIGSVVIARLGDFRHKGAAFVYGTVACALTWTVFALSTLPWLSVALMFLAGLCSATFMVLQATLLLLAVPAAAHGRAFGMLQLAIAIQPLGALLLGVLAERFGLAPMVAASTLTLAVVTLLITARFPALARFS